MRDEQRHFPGGKIRRTLKDLVLATSVKRRTKLVDTDQSNTFPGIKVKIQPVQHNPIGARIDKGNVAKFEPLLNRTRRSKRIRLRLNRRLHLEESQQISEEQRLVGYAGESREDLLNI